MGGGRVTMLKKNGQGKRMGEDGNKEKKQGDGMRESGKNEWNKEEGM